MQVRCSNSTADATAPGAVQAQKGGGAASKTRPAVRAPSPGTGPGSACAGAHNVPPGGDEEQAATIGKLTFGAAAFEVVISDLLQNRWSASSTRPTANSRTAGEWRAAIGKPPGANC